MFAFDQHQEGLFDLLLLQLRGFCKLVERMMQDVVREPLEEDLNSLGQNLEAIEFLLLLDLLVVEHSALVAEPVQRYLAELAVFFVQQVLLVKRSLPVSCRHCL